MSAVDFDRRPLTPYLRAEQRYANDNTYHAMVDMLTSVIARLEMTPAEVREAAIYACIRFEHLNISDMRRFYRGDDGPIPASQAADMRDELNRCQQRASDLEKWLTGGQGEPYR